MTVDNQRFKMMPACPPPIQSGKYTVSARQTVSSPVSDAFSGQQDIYITGPHFTLSPDEVHALYPMANASGNYGDCIGHITMRSKTFPWENSTEVMDAGTETPEPWLALICVSSDEDSTEAQLPISQLLKTAQEHSHIFFPLTKLPACTEKPEDLCSVVDLPLQLFSAIMPRQNELALLTHVKVVDMYDKCDELVSMDGFFSVVVSNRFVPSGSEDIKKSTLHLVSLEGFAGYLPEGPMFERLCDYKTIRMVSLYRWNVYSTRKGEADFAAIIKNIKSGPLAMDGHAIFQRGYVPLKHLVRSGESTVSLYRGPLAPYRVEKKEIPDKFTADGRIVYDPQNGIFDMSYGAAWQLGRLMTLKNKSVAAAIVRWRRNCDLAVRRLETRKILQHKLSSFTSAPESGIVDFWVKELSRELTEKELIGPVCENPKKWDGFDEVEDGNGDGGSK